MTGGKVDMRVINVDLPERVETEGVRFGDDWPGFFLRGDDALYVAALISSAFALEEIDALSLQTLKGYADLIFEEVPFKQWLDEDGHSIIQASSGDPEEEPEDVVHVRRDGKITRDEDEEDEDVEESQSDV